MIRTLGALVCSATVLFAVPAAANERVSTSNQPAIGLTDLLKGTEDTLLSAMPDEMRATLKAMLAPPASTELQYDKLWLARLPRATGGPEFQCLAEAIYFEARGESVKGQAAVAEVILNRRDSGLFPDTVCGVVHQGTGKRYQCQFTYTCDGKTDRIREHGAYERTAKIARLMLDGAPRALTQGALYYHNRSVYPAWARRFALTVKIGAHRFYRR